VQWDLDSPEVAAAAEGRDEPRAPLPDAPVVNGGPLPHADPVLVEIPASINETKRVSPEEGVRWREQTREAIVHYLARGFRVTGFYELKGGRRAYAMGSGGST
jgi:predicted GNAT superfamily acetyltransferase